MSITRQVLIECDVTGEQLIVSHGDVIWESQDDPRYISTVNLAGSYALRDAMKLAYRLGWRTHTKRTSSGYFQTISDVPDSTRARYHAPYVTAPGVEADPPYSVTAQLELDRMAKHEDAQEAEMKTPTTVVNQLAHLREEVARLRALIGEGAVSA